MSVLEFDHQIHGEIPEFLSVVAYWQAVGALSDIIESVAEMEEIQHLTNQWVFYISCLLPTCVTRFLPVTSCASKLLKLSLLV